MTAKKDLKRRIRARQAQTGESYTTARRHVLAARPDPESETEPSADVTAPGAAATTPTSVVPPPALPIAASLAPAEPAIVVEEMVDFSAEAHALGLRCRVVASAALAAQLPPGPVLTRMRDILLGTTEDPALERLRAVCLRGETVAVPRSADWLEKTRQFVQRARVGLGGVSSEGAILAFSVDTTSGSVMVLGNIGFRPKAQLRPTEPPRIVLSALVEDGFQASHFYVR